MSHVALVTGAGAGLGAALAESLARDGFDVAVHYRTSAGGAARTCDAIKALGRDAFSFAADLAREAEARALARAVEERFGRLDVLVNNAGSYSDRSGIELTEDEWRAGLDSTVTQTFFVTRACLPLLRAGTLRRVVNVGDAGADRIGARDRAWSYHIGKAGVWMLTRSFAATEAHAGVAVNMVSPGVLARGAGGIDPQRVPAGRLGTPADVYAAVRFYAMEAPPYVTGSNLVVAGGWNLR